MSQTAHRDLEGGGNPVDTHHTPRDTHRSDDQHRRGRSTSSLPPRSSGEEEDLGDSSWTLYSIYSKIAEDEDKKRLECCQKAADGTLIFTGLFSATVGALLTVTIPDLKPNSQDISAFHLSNIYSLYGSPNTSHSLTPSALVEPPAFSPPRHAIWVNALWFLSLTIGLSSAMEATMFRAWAVYYTSVTCRPDTPMMRARTRAFFSQRVGDFWGMGEEHALLHLSVLLFIIGGLIYVFNINRSIFYAVVWWFGFMAMGYADMSTRVFIYPRSLFRTPLSPPALRIYLGISYAIFQIRSHISSVCGSHNNTGWRHRNLLDRYSHGISIGKLRQAKEIASKPSSTIDSQILEQILLTLDDDRTLEIFFDAIPGFCNSKLSVLPLSLPVQGNLRQALDGFLDRTFSSSIIPESVRTSRLITCLNAAHAALEPHAISAIFDKISNGHWDEALKSVEIGHALRLWGHNQDYDKNIRQILACIIACVRERDDRWILLVKETFGVPERVLLDYLAHGDSVLLSILIHVSRQANNRVGSWTPGILTSLSALDIHGTLPELQHDFCALWNETVQEARNQGSSSTPVEVLREIRHLYLALHQSTDAAPTAFSTSTDSLPSIMNQPSSYPLCEIASHRSDSTAHVQVPVASGTIPPPTQVTQPGDSPADASPHRSTLDYSTALLAKETNMITGLPSPPDPSTASETRETSQVPTAPFPINSSSRSSDESPQDGVAAVASAQAGTTSAAKLSSGKTVFYNFAS